MAYLLIAAFVLTVGVLAFASSRSGRSATGCCAPADPADDLRMRDVTDG